jgi:mannose-6-phosphate isomerase-like protein (cupin superfamily)
VSVSTVETTIRIDKPWGYELIWARTDRYVGKILHLWAGEALSLQYHRVKDETIRVLSGRLRLETEDESGTRQTTILVPGAGAHIPPGLRHRMEAVEECEVLEVSTPELDDIVRLEDRYGRVEPTGRGR